MLQCSCSAFFGTRDYEYEDTIGFLANTPNELWSLVRWMFAFPDLMVCQLLLFAPCVTVNLRMFQLRTRTKLRSPSMYFCLRILANIMIREMIRLFARLRNVPQLLRPQYLNANTIVPRGETLAVSCSTLSCSGFSSRFFCNLTHPPLLFWLCARRGAAASATYMTAHLRREKPVSKRRRACTSGTRRRYRLLEVSCRSTAASSRETRSAVASSCFRNTHLYAANCQVPASIPTAPLEDSPRYSLDRRLPDEPKREVAAEEASPITIVVLELFGMILTAWVVPGFIGGRPRVRQSFVILRVNEIAAASRASRCRGSSDRDRRLWQTFRPPEHQKRRLISCQTHTGGG